MGQANTVCTFLTPALARRSSTSVGPSARKTMSYHLVFCLNVTARTRPADSNVVGINLANIPSTFISKAEALYLSKRHLLGTIASFVMLCSRTQRAKQHPLNRRSAIF